MLRVWDLDAGICQHTLAAHSHGVRSVSITPNGRSALSGGTDRAVRVWDLESGTCIGSLQGHSDIVLSVSITPDGRLGVSGSRDNSLRVWDLGKQDCLLSVARCNGVDCVCVTADGRVAFSGGQDGTLRAWNLLSGVCLNALKEHESSIRGLSITPDGLTAVSVGAGSILDKGQFDTDIELRTWNIARGICLHTESGHRKGISCVSIAPNGRRFVTGALDKTLKIWGSESVACLRTLSGIYWAEGCVSVTSDCRKGVSAGQGGRYMFGTWKVGSVRQRKIGTAGPLQEWCLRMLGAGWFLQQTGTMCSVCGIQKGAPVYEYWN